MWNVFAFICTLLFLHLHITILLLSTAAFTSSSLHMLYMHILDLSMLYFYCIYNGINKVCLLLLISPHLWFNQSLHSVVTEGREYESLVCFGEAFVRTSLVLKFTKQYPRGCPSRGPDLWKRKSNCFTSPNFSSNFTRWYLMTRQTWHRPNNNRVMRKYTRILRKIHFMLILQAVLKWE